MLNTPTVLSSAMAAFAFSLGLNAHAADAIKVGVVTPLSGSYAPIGKQVRWGAELAGKEINAAGGAAGRRSQVRKIAPARQGRSSHWNRKQRVHARGRPGCGTKQSHPGHDRILCAVDHRRAMQSERLSRERQRLHAVERVDLMADEKRGG